MKTTVIIIMITTLIGGCNTTKINTQKRLNSSLQTEKYAGVFVYGNDKGATGSVTVFPESNTSILFYISSNNGPTSYNSGELYGRIVFKEEKGIFNTTKYQYNEKSCKWSMHIIDDKLTIVTLDNNYECGFGHSVTADGIYIRKEKSNPSYFENRFNEKIYFAKTTPTGYENN